MKKKKKKKEKKKGEKKKKEEMKKKKKRKKKVWSMMVQSFEILVFLFPYFSSTEIIPFHKSLFCFVS